jgi:hypothetical protein
MGAQWTPVMLASLGLPALGLLLVAKPTTGLAIWIRRPTWWPVAGACLLTGISFALFPHWIGAWRAALAEGLQRPEWRPYVYHAAPLTQPGGWLLLAALLRWRRPEARMLLALACVPQAGQPYDLLTLFAVAETRREWVLLVASTQLVAAFGFAIHSSHPDVPGFVTHVWPAMLGLGYLPALAMILRRPARLHENGFV